jgi:hypothetical protein
MRYTEVKTLEYTAVLSFFRFQRAVTLDVRTQPDMSVRVCHLLVAEDKCGRV